jgi:hypothetical protein
MPHEAVNHVCPWVPVIIEHNVWLEHSYSDSSFSGSRSVFAQATASITATSDGTELERVITDAASQAADRSMEKDALNGAKLRTLRSLL